MSTKRVYIAGRLQKEAECSFVGWKGNVDFHGLADGCIGVMLVFSNKKMAKKFAGKFEVINGIIPPKA